MESIDKVGEVNFKQYPIKAILVQNFRSIERFIVDFSDSPIISIVGDNEAGKSSVTKALQTIGANMRSRNQKDYIRDDTPGFILAIKFLDPEETMIVRMKQKRGVNGFSVQKGDKVVWSVSKMDDGSLPPEVQKYAGFVIEPETQELLNVRTYEDLVMFVNTSGGTNYKVVYNALKVDNILAAKKHGQKELNLCSSRVNQHEQKIEVLNEELRRVHLVDLDPLLKIKEKINESYASLSKLEEATATRNNLLEMDRRTDAMSSLSRVGNLNELYVYTLESAMTSKEKISSLGKKLVELDEISSLKPLDTELTNALEACRSAKDRLDSISEDTYADVLKVESIDLEMSKILVQALELREKEQKLTASGCIEIERVNLIEVRAIENLEMALKLRERLKELNLEQEECERVTDIRVDGISLLGEAMEAVKRVRELLGIEEQTRVELEAANNELKSLGVEVATCPNCGETIVLGQ